MAWPVLLLRSAVGGVLMGLANLVPGISGGTMLLAAGIYPRFVDAVARVTTFHFSVPSITVLGSVAGAAAVSIVFLAGTVKELVVDHRWIMYSLFIGLTLGGVPIIWRMIKRHSAAMWCGAVCGFAGMAVLAVLQQSGLTGGGDGTGDLFMLFLAGVAGASAMILPGVSGGYLLLVLGQYVPILSAIDRFKNAAENGDMDTVLQVGAGVGLPVGLGVIAGIVGVSNILRLFLKRYPRQTLGVLLGLLFGAVVGLWPFQETVTPEAGDTVKGRVMTSELIQKLEPDDYPTEFFRPNAKQAAGAAGIIIAGFSFTCAISLLGRREDEPLS
jgi:putative membrane protein